MNPALWGLASALAFGTNDLIFRISGREVGTGNAAFGAFIAGAIALGLWLWVTRTPLVWSLEGIVPLFAAGVGLAAATLVLVGSLSRGPVSVVAPIIHAYPVFVVVWALFLGIVPTPLQWGAMGAVMLGVWIVARTSHEAVEAEPAGKAGFPLTFLLAVLAAGSFAVVIMLAREAAVVYGEVQTLWFSRLIGLVTLIVYMLGQRAFGQRQSFRVPLRWWPPLAAIGILDSAGIVMLVIGVAGEGAALAAVASSAAAVVSVLLARIFLREPVPAKQWAGVVLVAIGVAMLAYYE